MDTKADMRIRRLLRQRANISVCPNSEEFVEPYGQTATIFENGEVDELAEDGCSLTDTEYLTNNMHVDQGYERVPRHAFHPYETEGSNTIRGKNRRNGDKSSSYSHRSTVTKSPELRRVEKISRWVRWMPVLRVMGGAFSVSVVIVAITVIWPGLQPGSAQVSVAVPPLASASISAENQRFVDMKDKNKAGETNRSSEYSDTNKTTVISNKSLVTVYISGAVKYPGIVEIEENSRIADAIKKIGGATKDADLNRVNLAQKLTDGEHIHIPQVGEATNAEAVNTNIHTRDNGLLNINSATKEQLEGIPGIGPALAQRIIDFRAAKGTFQSVEEIADVSGIGQRLLEQIRNIISV